MNARVAAPSSLRIVHSGDAPPATALRRGDALRRARTQVAAENHASAGLSLDDARWAFAASVAQSLQGGRAGILPPATRQRLLGMGERLGLRPFDASLVIAIVQDGARSGEGALGPPVEGRLRMVRPARRAEGSRPWVRVAASGALAMVMLAAMIRWITTV